MWIMWKVLLLVILGVVQCRGGVINFNSSSPCSSGCNFTDSSIWVGGVVPIANDTVYIINDVGATVSIVANSDIVVESLYLNNISLLVSAFFSISSETFINSSMLSIAGESVLNSLNGTFILDAGSSLTLANASTFYKGSGQSFLYGSIFTTSASSFTCFADNTTFHPRISTFGALAFFESVSIHGNISFESGLNCNGYANIEPFSNVYVHNFLGSFVFTLPSTSTFGLVGVTNSPLLLAQNGYGTVAIISSMGVKLFTINEFTANLILGGKSDISFYLSSLDTSQLSFVNGINDEPANITFNVSPGTLVWTNQQSILSPLPIHLLISPGARFQLLGSFSFWDINNNGSIRVGNGTYSSSVTTSGPVLLTGYAASLEIANGTLTSSLITLNGNSQDYPSPFLSSTSTNVSINSNILISSGSIRIFSGASLVVNGNVSLGSGSGLSLYDLSTSDSRFTIFGSIELGGNVGYYNTSMEKKSKYIVLNTTDTIKGSFIGKAYDYNSGSHATAGFDYSELHYVYVVLHETSGLKWYYWLAIGVGGILAIIIITIIVMRCRKSEYAPVRS